MQDRSRLAWPAGLLALVGLAAGCGGPPRPDSAATAAFTVRDPVCRKEVVSDPSLRHAYGGRTYCFCGRECLETFKRAPDRYAAGPPLDPTARPHEQPKKTPEESGDGPSSPPHGGHH
ncbi:MAG: YHS domain-containing protein [Planctomycetes bacterium]|nr:YHS domain-containing protein [Planctomycetota bacterium]